MRLHTLGPAVTDSYAAAQYYNETSCDGQAEIVGHPSFETILTHLTAYAGDWLIIPAAFQSPSLQASWGDIHYALLSQMTLTTCFMTELDPLVVVARTDADNRIGYTHAATAQLLKRTVSNVVVQTAASKFLAYQQYQENQAGYVLTNEKNVTLSANEKILKRLTPSMVWCVYQIKDDDTCKH